MATTKSDQPLLSLRGVSKAFGRTQALAGVDLDVHAGEFVGLMGPNGAGKSTLIKILDGVYTPDSGTIVLDGYAVANLGTEDSVGFVHQDLGLVEGLSISDNLRMGERAHKRLGVIINFGAERALAAKALERVGLTRDPGTMISALSPGERALVAVARALDKGARLIVVDEATSTLAPSDSRRLIASLRRVVGEGASVIMVSHKLSEIMASADRIVVIQDGCKVVDRPRAGLDEAGVLPLLYGRAIDEVQHAAADVGDVILEAQQVSGSGCGPVNLQLRAGQVLGFTGLPGSGLHDVALVLAGKAAVTGGHLSLPTRATRAIVPPHRESQGGFGEMSVLVNMTISALKRWRRPWGLLSDNAERSSGEAMVERLSVTPPGLETEFAGLSGGNKQKVIFGRVMLQGAGIYVLCEPTRGVDVQTRAQLYRLIRELVAGGAGVLIFTSDAEDLFAVCDFVAVIEEGQIGTLHARSTLTAHMIEELV